MDEKAVGAGVADQTDDAEAWPGIEDLPPSPPTEWVWRPWLPKRPPELPTEPKPRRRWLAPRPVIALTILVALALGALAWTARPATPDAAAPATTTTSAAPTSSASSTPTTTTDPAVSTTTSPPPPITIPPDPPLADAVAELTAFVSEIRGHPFAVAPPTVRLDDDEFDRQARATYDPEAIEQRGAWLKLLGLIDDVDDYVRSYIDDNVHFTAAYFDPTTKTVVLRGQTGTPLSDDDREILVHELTHVLDDQLFPFDRPAVLDPTTEVAFGFAAVVEGDAQRVAHEWGRRHGRTPGSVGGGTYADVITAQIDAKYDLGEVLIDVAARRGGEAEVDRSLADPPVTSEQVLHPDAYAAREPEVPLDLPTSDAPGVEGPPVGELLTRQLLAVVVGDPAATESTTGWGGDRTIEWVQAPADGGMTCLRTRYVMDTPGGLDLLEEQFAEWAAGHDDRAVTRADAFIEVTTCALVPPPPGAAGAASASD